MLCSILNRSCISIHSQTTDDCLCFITQVAVIPEGLPLVYVGDVNLDERYINTEQCVPQRYTRVCESPWVDNNSIDLSSRFVYVADDNAFVVRLDIFELKR